MSEQPSFFSQPNTDYRNFQIVFISLAAMFGVSAVGYTFAPGQLLDGMAQINSILGGSVGFDFPDRSSQFWRLLGCGNVVTLAVCCYMLHRNLLKNYAVVIPLACMKGFVAVAWTVVFLTTVREPLFLVAGLFDGLRLFVILWFVPRAKRCLEASDVSSLVPALK